MEPRLDSIFQNSPVSQENLQAPDMEVWEPPFERWLRIADSSLGDAALVKQRPTVREI